MGTFSAHWLQSQGERDGIERTFAIAHLLEGRFVAEGVLSRLDDERKACRNRFCRLCGLGLFCGGHCVSVTVGWCGGGWS
jgi:hypothetical protein